MPFRPQLLSLAAVGLLASVTTAQPDLEAVHRIREEALDHSQVMRHVFWLTDVHGPRLTNSPGYDAAASWATELMRSWKLDNVALEPWGPYGRGWSASHFEAHLLEPSYAPLIGVPLTWTPSTDGRVEGTPLYAPLAAVVNSGDPADRRAADDALEAWIEGWTGQLAGRIVLADPIRALAPHDEAEDRRFTDEDLAERALAPDPRDQPFEPAYDAAANEAAQTANAPDPRQERRRILRQRRDRLNRFLVDEGTALVIRGARFGDGGTLFPPVVGSQLADAVDPPATIALTPEHYNRIARLVVAGLEPRVAVEVRTRFHDDSLDTTNVVAEIRGRSRPDEVVIVGAHLDDVVHATGATDNAAGCAVMIEVMRILKTLDLPLERTVRMVLWSGEEEGLLGSRAYVRAHFGDPRKGTETAEHARVSAYYNLDNGTGRIRGIYLQGNDVLRPLFKTWLEPFADLGATTLTIRDTDGTDHLSFDAVGIPGFQFIQDPVEYRSRTHHSNMDVYDRIQEADLKQAAAVIASFVYHTANHDSLLPRKPVAE